MIHSSKYIVIISAAIIIGCSGGTYENDTQLQQNNSDLQTAANTSYSVQVFNNDTLKASSLKGYGYDIFQNNQLLIHQPVIPAAQGNKGFKSEKNAKRAADLVVHKLKNNIMPPSVSLTELDSLGVLE